jgi:hypothetical protein
VSSPERHQEQRLLRLAVLKGFLAAQGCKDCGTLDRLQLDHRPGTEKCFEPADVSNRAWARLWDEWAKCDVRCASCHVRRHLRERAATRTHCPSGHAYIPSNIYIRPNGVQECRTCIRIRLDARRDKSPTEALRVYRQRLVDAGVTPSTTSPEQEEELQQLVLEVWKAELEESA